MSEPKTAEWYAHKIANDEDCEGMAAYGWALKWVREAIAQGQRQERERWRKLYEAYPPECT